MSGDTTTPKLGLTKPQVGASRNTWGNKWNANADSLDAKVLPLTGGSLTGQLNVPTVAVSGAVTAAQLFVASGDNGIGTAGGGYLTLNGANTFGAANTASLVISGGSRGAYAFEFYAAGARLASVTGDGELFATSYYCWKPGGGPWIDSSDVRIKQDVGDYRAGLEQILRLRPVSYRFRPETERDDKLHYGLIAQEVEAIMPEMVTSRAMELGRLKFDDMRALDTQALIFAVVNSIKELNGRIDMLQNEITALRARDS